MTKELSETAPHTPVQNPNQNGQVIQTSYSGPLPPASEYAKYEQVHPGSADRILIMAEDQSHHRQAIETYALRHRAWSSFLGTICAFILALAGILGGVFLIFMNKPIFGFVSLLTPLGAIIGAFLYREHQRNKSEE